jgi:hypothetical protein
MSALVRCFTHDGVVSVPVANQALQASDTAFLLLKQPYRAKESLTVEGSTVSTDAATAPNGVTCIVIEVQTGKEVGYEITTENAELRSATTDSPRLTGRNVLQFGAGWRASFIEIA